MKMTTNLINDLPVNIVEWYTYNFFVLMKQFLFNRKKNPGHLVLCKSIRNSASDI